MMSPRSKRLERSATVCSTTAAGTIIQATRGFLSLAAKSSSDDAPIAPFLGQLLDRVGADVKHHAFVTAAHQPPHHVRTHSAETDHSHLHFSLLLVERYRY